MARSVRPPVVAAGAVEVARVCAAVAVFVSLFPSSARGDASARPPTSLEPAKTTRKVELSYRHRLVRACTAIPTKSPKGCAPQMSDTGVATTVALEPVSVRAGAPSPSLRVVVSFSDAAGPQTQTVELAVGEWAIEWPGCPDAGRLIVAAATSSKPSVALAMTSGRCELSGSRCALVGEALEQTVTIGR